jgi:phage shock protein PspC (stress-responsive transcriptional regulator)
MRERLYRSRSDRMLFGVAGGMARYLDLDPAIVRIVWALLVLAVGLGFLLYIIAAIVIPEEPAGYAPASNAGTGGGVSGAGSGPGTAAPGPGFGPVSDGRAGRNGNGAVLLGVALVLIGGWLLLQRFIPAIPTDIVWPVLLLGLGAALVIGAMRR